jgi:hypothetical protein
MVDLVFLYRKKSGSTMVVNWTVATTGILAVNWQTQWAGEKE